MNGDTGSVGIPAVMIGSGGRPTCSSIALAADADDDDVEPTKSS